MREWPTIVAKWKQFGFQLEYMGEGAVMALFGKKKALENDNDQLRARIAYLEENASPEHKAREQARLQLEELQLQINELTLTQSRISAAIEALQSQHMHLDVQINEKSAQIVSLDDAILMQEFGLYEPRYDFMTVDEYKDEIKRLRDDQKGVAREMNERAKKTSWTVNGSASEGRKMVTDLSKLLLRAFNGECDEIIRKVKFSNIDASVKAIEKSAEAVTKLGRVVGVSIPRSIIESKKAEAYLSFEYARFKEQEKEKLRELKAQEREAKKLEKEIEAERKKLEKEQKQYNKALEDVLSQLSNAPESEKPALEAKRAEIEANLSEVAKAVEDVDYRAANQRAGYVYVISNIGSFGEGVYKIGMTRRLDPMERVKELGDASVPFDFDVHALIFSDDAPGLEAALHHEFENRKLNLVNHRREFFKCSLEEIKSAVLKNYDQTVEFVSIPDAEQYRVSEKMRQQNV